MRILPKEVFRFNIPLCQMIYMLLVCSTLGNDIKRLEVKFTHGHRPRVPMFYISICNKYDEEQVVKDKDTSNWGPNWTLVNDEFEAKLASNLHLRFFLWLYVFYL